MSSAAAHCTSRDPLDVNLSCVPPGKTELLYHLLCRCVLPVACGGLEVEVVFVDTDYSLDMLRLVSILDSRLSSGTHTHTGLYLSSSRTDIIFSLSAVCVCVFSSRHQLAPCCFG